MFPSTRERVTLHTAEQVNAEIARQTEENLTCLAPAGPEAIDRRLAELEREWDIERTLEANAATATLIGSALGFTVDRRFFAVPIVVGGFLLLHALQGWCPPVPVFRRLGFRKDGDRFYQDLIVWINPMRIDNVLVLLPKLWP